MKSEHELNIEENLRNLLTNLPYIDITQGDSVIVEAMKLAYGYALDECLKEEYDVETLDLQFRGVVDVESINKLKI